MKLHRPLFPAIATCFITSAILSNISAQTGTSLPAAALPAEEGLFDRDEIVHITLRGNVKSLLKDKTAKPKSFSFELLYTSEDSTKVILPVEVRQRGHFRRLLGNCIYPPLLIDFPKEGPHLSSVFRKHKKNKTGIALQK